MKLFNFKNKMPWARILFAFFFSAVLVLPFSGKAASDFSSCVAENNYDPAACCKVDSHWPECKAVTPSPAPGPAPTPSPTPSPSPSPSSGNCGTGFTSQNGLCLPNSPFGSTPGSIAGAQTIFDIVATVLKILLTVAGVVAVVWLIIAGFQYMTAGGNEEQAEKARKAITNAVIGLIVVILSYAIVTIITKFLTTGDITK